MNSDVLKVKEEPDENIEQCSWSTEEELECPAAVFVKTEAECDSEEVFEDDESSNVEAGQGNAVYQVEEEEELERPATVFLKTEEVCEIEESFQEEEERQNEEACQENETSQDEHEVLPPPSSESVFLASIKQKIGALFPGAGTSNKLQTAGGPCTKEAIIGHSPSGLGKPFCCPISNELFATNGVSVPPLRGHRVGKPYQNNICKKKTRQKNNLFRHMRLQTGEKPFQCYVCNKYFTEREDLITHMRAHTGGKPYQCDVCTKIFWQKCNFFAHMRIHTGEKPFQCNVCNRNFTQRGGLIAHMRTHTGDKPYQCKVCKKRYTQCSGLKAHMVTHTGKKLADSGS